MKIVGINSTPAKRTELHIFRDNDGKISHHETSDICDCKGKTTGEHVNNGVCLVIEEDAYDTYLSCMEQQ